MKLLNIIKEGNTPLPKILWHATSYDNLDSIMHSGLKPGREDPVIYFTDDARNSAKFMVIRGMDHIIAIPVPLSKLNKKYLQESFDHSESFFKTKAWMYSKPIPSSAILHNKIMVWDLRKGINEAVIDVVHDDLSDIFINGKLKPSVRNIIKKNVDLISKQFPELKIHDYIVVGAAVTYQYDDRSDIDVSVFIDPNTDKDLFKTADKWIEKNIDNKYYFGKRPYQFKLTVETRNDLDKVESAYDPQRDKWIKQPKADKSRDLYNKTVADPNSKVVTLYKKIEQLVQPSLLRLKSVLNNIFEASIEDEAKQKIISAYNRYDKVIKPLRAKAFNTPVNDAPSRNWNTGNLIYKMLDREGYNSVYMLMKNMVRNDDFSSDNLRQLKDRLSNIVPQEIGFVRKDNY